VILRDPKSSDTTGRSAGFLKHKARPLPSSLSHVVMLLTRRTFKKFRDMEARIVSRVDQHQWKCEL
jgi:hypothetical protein